MKKTAIYLISLLAIMFVSMGSMAQGGLTPLVNSTHTYTITPGGSNTLAWTVSPATGYTINSGASTASVSITWTTAGTYTLTFTETTGSTCSTVKTATIVVGSNTLDISAITPSATCNAATGQTNFAGSSVTTAVSYTINMATGNSSWSPSWEFTFTLTPSSGVTVANVKAGSTTLTPVTGTYTASGISSTSGNGTVNITMDVTGNIYTLNTVALTITSAKESQYNTPDSDNTDWAATQTINAVPNTSSISTD